MDVSIIIVNYNTKELLKNCLISVFKHTKDVTFEVIISDNGSSDDSIQMIKNEFKNIILIENNKNIGFGAANNKGTKIAKGKYIFFLNSDTILENNAVKLFFDYWEYHQNEHIGALGANLLDSEHKTIHSYGIFPNYQSNLKELVKMMITNFVLSIFYLFHISINKFVKPHYSSFYLGEVDYITGADLFVKNDLYAQFDESFFLYFEETDLQKKLSNAKLKRLIIDGPKILHLCGGSVGTGYTIKRKASFSRIQFELSRINFLKKHYHSSISLFFIRLLITIIWLNPLLLGTTKKYLKKIWK